MTSPTVGPVGPVVALQAQTPTLDDAALDDALEPVRELSLRLWAVRGVHRPRRSLLGVRCSACAQPHPCVTLQAVQ